MSVNLVLNALEAMPEGGELTVETDLADADAVGVHRGELLDQFVCISVADNGIGIPESLQAVIFEPFFTTKPGKGAGLGLSSAYRIVRQHHGNIKVQSQPGAGTNSPFIFLLEKHLHRLKGLRNKDLFPSRTWNGSFFVRFGLNLRIFELSLT